MTAGIVGTLVPIAGAACLGAVLQAQQPRVTGGAVTPQPVGSSLAATFRTVLAAQPASGAAWFGYRVPMVAGERQACCGSWNGTGFGTCRLEGDTGVTSRTRGAGAGGAPHQPARGRLVL
jgi:hypothetical protein